jgi:4-amino-4-deoxy-L-arabinose transferase-like glycosyltransferase
MRREFVDPYAETLYHDQARAPLSSRPTRPQSTAPSAAPRENRDYTATFILIAIALVLRLSVAFYFAGEPVWDGHYYHFGAARLAHGLGYSEDVFKAGHWVWKPWTHYPVGYSFWLSLFYRAFGTHVFVALIANAIVGALTVFGIHRLGFHFLGQTRGRIAGAIAALHPGLLVYTAVVMSEPLAAALTILSVLSVVALRPRSLGLVLGGLLLGASVLVRPSSLLALPLVLFVVPGGFKKRLVSSVVVTGFCFAAILPWTARNCRRMDGCALVSTNGGWNLAIGALTETGRFRPLRATDGCPVVTGQVQQDNCFRDLGIKVILSRPLNWLKLAPAKLSQTFDHESFAVEYFREANPVDWPEARRVMYRERLTFAHRLILWLSGFSVLGWVTGTRALKNAGTYVQWGLLVVYLIAGKVLFDSDTHPFFWLSVVLPIVAFLPLPGRPRFNGIIAYAIGLLALTALTHVIFFGDDRYHLVVTPWLCLLVAAALRRPGLEAVKP